MIEIFKTSTGYKRLDVYILMNVIQLETLAFCRRFLDYRTDDPCGRQFDQMTQAARSGVKNLTEGSEREATSAQNTLKLLDVAKASLCELRDDYMTWLLDRDLPPWRVSSPEAQEVYSVLLDKADYGDDLNFDVATRIIATRRKFAKWFRGDVFRPPLTRPSPAASPSPAAPHSPFTRGVSSPAAPDSPFTRGVSSAAVDSSRQPSAAVEKPAAAPNSLFPRGVSSAAVDSSRQPSVAVETSRPVDSSRQPSAAVETSRPVEKPAAAPDSPFAAASRTAAGIRFANAMLILIGRSLNMLGSLMSRLGEEFRREGGFSERMTAARVEAKREARKPVDEDAPKCPLCGGPMRLRHSVRGDFWGCLAYPTCRGTREA